MAKEAVSQLFREVQGNIELRSLLNAAPKLEDFVQLANSHGFDFTISEWQEVTSFLVEELEGELSEIPGI